MRSGTRQEKTEKPAKHTKKEMKEKRDKAHAKKVGKPTTIV
jgi:hypothetical protein